MLKKLNVVDMWVFRRTLKMSWAWKIVNAEVLLRTAGVKENKKEFMQHINRRLNIEISLMGGNTSKGGRGRYGNMYAES